MSTRMRLRWRSRAAESAVCRRTLRSRIPSPAADQGHDHKQQADEEHQIANAQHGWFGDNRNVVKVAHQYIEGNLITGVHRPGIRTCADARDADSGTQRNHHHRRNYTGCGRMMVDRGEQASIGDQDILVLHVFANFGCHRSLDGDQIDTMAVRLVALQLASCFHVDGRGAMGVKMRLSRTSASTREREPGNVLPVKPSPPARSPIRQGLHGIGLDPGSSRLAAQWQAPAGSR